jgi:hypothetical protein
VGADRLMHMQGLMQNLAICTMIEARHGNAGAMHGPILLITSVG